MIQESAIAARRDDRSAASRTALRRLVLHNFRNIAAADLTFPREGVVILGENGHGKSNLLEAIRYLTILRSARNARDTELIRHGENSFYVGAEAWTTRELNMSAAFERSTATKKIQLDGVAVPKFSDAFGVLPAILVSPGDVELIVGGPAGRRRMMDVLLAMITPQYLSALQMYRAALARRNSALRTAMRGNADENSIAVWEPMLAESGAILWQLRRAWVEKSAPLFTQLCADIGESGAGGIAHQAHAHAPELTASQLGTLLEQQRRADIRRGRTSVGPHCDDLRITLDDRDLRLFGSGGQQRTAALALRFIEAGTLRDHLSDWPILLLDDPFAELDARRSERILRLVQDRGRGQVVLAVPRDVDVPAEFTALTRWGVRSGVFGGARDG